MIKHLMFFSCYIKNGNGSKLHEVTKLHKKKLHETKFARSQICTRAQKCTREENCTKITSAKLSPCKIVCSCKSDPSCKSIFVQFYLREISALVQFRQLPIKNYMLLTYVAIIKKTTDRNSLKVPESPNTQRVNRISTDEVLENKKLEESNL